MRETKLQEPYFTDDIHLLKFIQEEVLGEKYCDICGKAKQRGRIFKLKINEERKCICFECFVKKKLKFDQIKVS